MAATGAAFFAWRQAARHYITSVKGGGVSEAMGRERVATALFYGAVLLLAWLVYRIFEPFLVPLGWAAVLVVVFHPWHAWMEARWGRTRAAAVSTTLVTVVLIVPALLLGVAFVREGIDAVRAVQQARAEGQPTLIDSAQRAWEWVQARIPVSLSLNLPELAGEAAQRVGAFLAARTGTVVANVLSFFVDLTITLFAVFFLFRDRAVLVERLRLLLPFAEQQRTEMIERARDLIHASVTSSLIIAVVQGALGGLALWGLGIPSPLFWAVVMAFLSLLPLVGPSLVLLPAAAWLLLSGAWVKAVILVVIALGVVGTADNLLRPILVSGRAQMSTLVLFISVLGGISVFGMLGLVLGPIVVATAASVMDVYIGRHPQQSPPQSAADSRAAVLE
jgi:predicted PurR-regulated permease PerM